MTIILLIRHGDTEYTGEKLAGRIDSPLNVEGKEQSERIAVALKHLPIKAIVASPMIRTQQTALPLARLLNLDIEICEGLNQVNFGDWQGLSFEELDQNPEWQTFQENPATAKIPGGEDGNMVRERVSKAVLALAKQYSDDSIIACYSHGSIIRHTISHFIGLPLDNLNQIRVATASISTLRLIDNQGTLLHLNQEISVNWL